MNKRLAHVVTGMYPRSWRDRYGEEFEALLVAGPTSFRTLLEVVRSALKEQMITAGALEDVQLLTSFGLILKSPSAMAPIGMSLAAQGTVLVQIVLFGVARQSDEGAAAHIWQLLIAGQMPVLLFFAVKWLPKAPRQARRVIALQVLVLLASMVPIFVLRW
jgi:hypothetical protein